MKLLIETWARIEAVIEADSADEARRQLTKIVPCLRGKYDGGFIEHVRVDSPIRCYDCSTGNNVDFPHKPSYVLFTKAEILELVAKSQNLDQLRLFLEEKRIGKIPYLLSP